MVVGDDDGNPVGILVEETLPVGASKAGLFVVDVVCDDVLGNDLVMGLSEGAELTFVIKLGEIVVVSTCSGFVVCSVNCVVFSIGVGVGLIEGLDVDGEFVHVPHIPGQKD